jgi:hypothetical protein
VTVGCAEALALALRVVARPGDTIAIESPTYFGLLHALEALELKALELPTDATEGIDWNALQRVLATGRIAACLFASSQPNPISPCALPTPCPRCGGRMIIIETFARGCQPKHASAAIRIDTS